MNPLLLHILASKYGNIKLFNPIKIETSEVINFDKHKSKKVKHNRKRNKIAKLSRRKNR